MYIRCFARLASAASMKGRFVPNCSAVERILDIVVDCAMFANDVRTDISINGTSMEWVAHTAGEVAWSLGSYGGRSRQPPWRRTRTSRVRSVGQ